MRVYVPQQREGIIVSQCWQSNSFFHAVQHMISDHFFDFEDLEKQFMRCKQNASKKDTLISKIIWMNFGQAIVNRSGKKVVEKHLINHGCAIHTSPLNHG